MQKDYLKKKSQNYICSNTKRGSIQNKWNTQWILKVVYMDGF